MSGPSSEFVTALILRGVESARKRTGSPMMVEGVDVAPLAIAGLDGVNRMAPALGRVGSARAGAILAFLSVGETDAAAAIYFAEVATFEELRAQVRQDGRDQRAKQLAREAAEAAAWDEILAVSAEVGLTALKIAVPLLLAAL